MLEIRERADPRVDASTRLNGSITTFEVAVDALRSVINRDFGEPDDGIIFERPQDSENETHMEPSSSVIRGTPGVHDSLAAEKS